MTLRELWVLSTSRSTGMLQQPGDRGARIVRANADPRRDSYGCRAQGLPQRLTAYYRSFIWCSTRVFEHSVSGSNIDMAGRLSAWRLNGQLLADTSLRIAGVMLLQDSAAMPEISRWWLITLEDQERSRLWHRLRIQRRVPVGSGATAPARGESTRFRLRWLRCTRGQKHAILTGT